MKGAGVWAGGMHTVYDANANSQFPLWCEEWGPEVGSLYRLSVGPLFQLHSTVMCRLKNGRRWRVEERAAPLGL
jgi:hypothetical protein